jgi:hypothetical protein
MGPGRPPLWVGQLGDEVPAERMHDVVLGQHCAGPTTLPSVGWATWGQKSRRTTRDAVVGQQRAYGVRKKA